MTQQEDVQKKSRRDLLLILLFLPFGILCMFLVGGTAIKLDPFWTLKANMDSHLKPGGNFVLESDSILLEPLNADILTLPAWSDLFLTPGAFTPPGVTPQTTPQEPPPETAPPPTEVTPTKTLTAEPPPPPTLPPPPTAVPVDLKITKGDGGVTTYAAGATINYTVTVTNIGSNDVTGATVTDNIPAQIITWDWACTTLTKASGCNAITGSSSNFNDTINIRSGGRIVYTVTARVDTNATGDLTNRAAISVPSDYDDVASRNNSATDTNVPYIDLVINKDDGASTYTPGGTVTYTVTVTNNSTFDLTGVTVTDDMPTLISAWSWTCEPNPLSSSATCDNVSGTGNIINNTVNLPAGASVIYTIDATVNTNATGTLENVASVSPPAGFVDAVTGNNTATDSNTSDEPDIGPPDGDVIVLTAGTTVTYLLSPAISSNGANTPDFVYFELYRNDTFTGIALDTIVIELSQDGVSWTQVFNWGDGNLDLNSKVHLAVNAVCGGMETDGCPIPASPTYLYSVNGFYSGIEIDIDSLGLSGSYPWIRFTCPTGPTNVDGTCEIDAIQPYYP